MPLQIVPRKEITIIEQLLKGLKDHCVLCSVVGLDGIGKTTFLRIMFEHIQKQDGMSICIQETISQFDRGPFDFLYRITRSIQSEIHPTKYKVSKLKGFFAAHPETISVAAEASKMAIPGAGPFIEPVKAGVSSIINKKDSEIYQSLLDTLNEFSQKANHKLIILIDDIDVNSQFKLIVSMFEDLKKRLLSNILLVVTSSNDKIRSDKTINLTNFDYNQTRMYLTMNLDSKMKEALILDIYAKSQGYPAYLEVLRLSFIQDKNIGSLLTRFGNEVFLEQLQRNFLDKLLSSLTDKEQKILISCCSLSSILDSLLISDLAAIDNGMAARILNDFKEKGIIDKINSFALRNGMLLDMYFLNPMIQKAIKAKYGSQPEINKKAAIYYANALLKNTYPNIYYVFNSILAEFSAFSTLTGSGIKPEAFFSLLNLDKSKKLEILFGIIDYYLAINEHDQVRSFATVVPLITQDIENNNFALAWNKLSSLVTIFAEFIAVISIGAEEIDVEKIEDNLNRILELGDEIEFLLKDEDNEEKKQLLFYTRLYTDSITTTIDESDKDSSSVDSFVKVVVENASKLGLVSDDKISEILVKDVMSSQGLGIKGPSYDFAIEIASSLLKELDTISENEKAE
jgi:hypothetical protein